MDDNSRESEIELAEYNQAYSDRVLDKILKSKAAKARVMKFMLDFSYPN